MLSSANRNMLWASTFVDELARAGLRAAVIAPGSRSTPLAFAFAANPRVTVYSLLDERSAAFFALGIGLQSGIAAAVLCTSGTAAANFLPAIVEANHARVPLLVLTADRPPEARSSGANQTVDQLKLYGDQVRWFQDVALPESNPSELMLRYLCSLADRALAVAAGTPAGAVHLNFPFRKPLEPTIAPGDTDRSSAAGGTKDRERPQLQITSAAQAPSVEQVRAVVDMLQGYRRPLIVCGPRCAGPAFVVAVQRLAARARVPLLADALSGVRFAHRPEGAAVLVFGLYENYIGSAVLPDPDLILRFGAPPISAALERLIDGTDAPQILISDSGVYEDPSHRLSALFRCDPAELCDSASEAIAAHPPLNAAGWAGQWAACEARAATAIAAAFASNGVEGSVVAAVATAQPAASPLFIGNSLPVRHLDQFAAVCISQVAVYCNRGASGIDGTISSALGVAASSGQRVTVLLGDLAFYHDLNALLALRRCGLQAIVVVLNNDGGGIFRRLPVAQFDPIFTDLFLTPHGLEFSGAAALFGLRYQLVDHIREFGAAFSAAMGRSGSQLIEVRTDSAAHELVRQRIRSALLDPAL